MPNFLSLWFRHLGKTGLAGLFLLLIAFLVYVSGTLTSHAKINALLLTLHTLEKNPSTIATGSKINQQASVKQVRMVHSHALPSVLRKIFELAANQDLDLIIGEYKYNQSQQEGMLKYEMSLPLQGRYQDTRHFLERLSTIPFLVVKNLDLKRSAVTDAKIDARLQLVLYLAEDEGGQAHATAQ